MPSVGNCNADQNGYCLKYKHHIMTVSRTLCDVGLPSSDARGLPPPHPNSWQTFKLSWVRIGSDQEKWTLGVVHESIFLDPTQFDPPDWRPDPTRPTHDDAKSWTFTAWRHASAVYAVVVCLSVCLSVRSQCSTETAERRITQTTPDDSQGL